MINHEKEIYLIFLLAVDRSWLSIRQSSLTRFTIDHSKIQNECKFFTGDGIFSLLVRNPSAASAITMPANGESLLGRSSVVTGRRTNAIPWLRITDHSQRMTEQPQYILGLEILMCCLLTNIEGIVCSPFSFCALKYQFRPTFRISFSSANGAISMITVTLTVNTWLIVVLHEWNNPVWRHNPSIVPASFICCLGKQHQNTIPLPGGRWFLFLFLRVVELCQIRFVADMECTISRLSFPAFSTLLVHCQSRFMPFEENITPGFRSIWGKPAITTLSCNHDLYRIHY